MLFNPLVKQIPGANTNIPTVAEASPKLAKYVSGVTHSKLYFISSVAVAPHLASSKSIFPKI